MMGTGLLSLFIHSLRGCMGTQSLSFCFCVGVFLCHFFEAYLLLTNFYHASLFPSNTPSPKSEGDHQTVWHWSYLGAANLLIHTSQDTQALALWQCHSSDLLIASDRKPAAFGEEEQNRTEQKNNGTTG